MFLEILTAVGMAVFGGMCLLPTPSASEPDEPAPEPTAEIDFITMSSHIRELHNTMEKIDKLDKMIIDISICELDRLHKTFRCTWQSGGGSAAYDFLTSGEDMTAENLLRMAEQERERLCTSLLKQIDRLYAERREKNGIKTLSPDKKTAAGEGQSRGR